MKNLSVIIKSQSEESLNQLLSIVDPLLNDYQAELIIITEAFDHIKTDYTYSIYKDLVNSADIKTLANSICKNFRILMLEEGYKIDAIFINNLKQILETENECSYIFTKKVFLGESSLTTYDSDSFIIYNKNSETQENLNIKIEDRTLIVSNLINVQYSLSNLINEKRYNEIITWYNNFIKYQDYSMRQKFYEILEITKNHLPESNYIFFEEKLIKDSIDSNYINYLKIQSLYRQKLDNYIEAIIILLKNTKINSTDMFWGAFIYIAFFNLTSVLEFIRCFDVNFLKQLIIFMMKNENNFYLYIYGYLLTLDLQSEISKANNKDIFTFSALIKAYIESMSERSEGLDLKNKLIQMFIDYTNYGFYIINEKKRKSNKIILDNETKFLIELNTAIEFINSNNIAEAINVLEKAKNLFPIMERVVVYYIQKIRNEFSDYKHKLSICMIVKDEEQNLDRCLSSFMPIVNNGMAELIVVDTGSMDSTVEIAKKYTKDIYFHEWQGNFSEARNYSISLAKGEYIFILDADEEIAPADLDNLISIFLNNSYKQYNTMSFRIKNFSDVEYTKFSVFTQNLIFKNDGSFHYAGSVHNQPQYKEPIWHTNISILHYGYIMTEDIKDKKFIRTATLLKKELEKNPESIYHRFQLSVSYSMHGDIEDALNEVEIYMKQLKDRSLHNRECLMYYNSAALVYVNNKLYEKAIEVSNMGLELQPDFIDYIYYKAISLYELEKYTEAMKLSYDFLELLKEFSTHEIFNDDKCLFYTLDSQANVEKMIMLCNYQLEQYKECIEYSKTLDDATYKNSLYVIIISYIKSKKYDQLVEIYRNKILLFGEEETTSMFTYFVEDGLTTLASEEQKNCILAFANSNITDDFTNTMMLRVGNEIKLDPRRTLSFIDSINIDEMDIPSMKMFVDSILPILWNYPINEASDSKELRNLKRSAKFILNRSLNLKQYTKLSKLELYNILDKYINICILLVKSGHEEHLEEYEINFLSNVLSAFEELQIGNLIPAVKYIKEAVVAHKEMAKPMELLLETIIPGYKSEFDYDKVKLKNELVEHGKTIKVKIEELINLNNFSEAEELITQYNQIIKDDPEIYSHLGVIRILQENYIEAITILKKGLEIDSYNFDILYNLGYLYNISGDVETSLNCYKKALNVCMDESIKDELASLIKEIKATNKELLEKVKIVFFVKNGLDTFINPIINALAAFYQTKKVIVSEYNQIDSEIQWGDICWFEWCDELIVYASKLNIPNKKLICRLHSYEAFTDFPQMVNWNNVDKIIFDVEHIKQIVLDKVEIPENKIVMIPVGVDIDKFKYSERNKGFNIAYVGYINYKKGPMLLIHFINELVKVDKRYKLFIGGRFQDDRDVLYFNQMIKEFDIEENVIFQGWIDNVDEWLEDKNYVVSTSLLEGQHLSVMEGMCKGIKPLVHNFVGAKGVYDPKYVWNSLSDAINMVINDVYSSLEYRSFVNENYSFDSQIIKINKMLTSFRIISNNVHDFNPLVTVGIINYNYSRYLDESILSVLNQTYTNLEVLIVDDLSKDGSIEKIRNYEANYSNIRGIYHTKNSGSAVLGFQEIIHEAKGEYFIFISADDYFVDSNVIQTYISSFRNSKLDFIYGNMRVVDINGNYKETWSYNDYSDDEIIYKTFTRMGSGVIPLTVGMFKKDFYLRHNLTWVNDENNIVAGDTLNTLINIKHGWKRKYINYDIICYRHHENNMTYNLKQRINSILSVLVYIRDNFSEYKYYPYVNWSNMEHNERKSLKAYLFGESLYNIFNYYYSNNFKPWDGTVLSFTKNELYDFLQPILKEMKICFKESLINSDSHSEEIRTVNLKLKEQGVQL